jgi:hypothetical protein
MTKRLKWRLWKWLRQQSKDLYAVGFYALVKQWDKCINVGGGYVKKYMFFPGLNITFYILYPFVTYLLTPSYYGIIKI